MDKSNMKNMIVLKDLPSNIVDEVIVVLKNNKKINNYLFVKNKVKKDEIQEIKNDKKYVIKQVEMVILNYLKEIENPISKKKSQNGLQRKYNKLKQINYFLIFLCFIITIAYLIK